MSNRTENRWIKETSIIEYKSRKIRETSKLMDIARIISLTSTRTFSVPRYGTAFVYICLYERGSQTYCQNEGHNDISVNTTFLIIQQVTKNGNFIGTNRLKHYITAMMELRLENPKNVYSSRYVVFTKHRRGTVGIRLYYDLGVEGDVFYDEKRFRQDQQIRSLQAKAVETASGETGIRNFRNYLASANSISRPPQFLYSCHFLFIFVFIITYARQNKKNQE